MNVIELIDLVAQLGFSRSTSTIKERANYQRFLNLANLELWQILINSKQFFQAVDVFLDDNGYGDLPLSYYYVKTVFADKLQMQKCELANILSIPQGRYTMINNRIQVNLTGVPTKTDPLDNIAKKYVTLLIVPSCKKLVENVVDANTEVNIPIFPEPHHLSLVHGALYYLFVSGKGYSDKIKYQLINWDNSKKNFQTFYG